MTETTKTLLNVLASLAYDVDCIRLPTPTFLAAFASSDNPRIQRDLALHELRLLVPRLERLAEHASVVLASAKGIISAMESEKL